MKTYKRTVHMMVPHENGQWVKLSEAQSTIAELTSRLDAHERAAQATIAELERQLAEVKNMNWLLTSTRDAAFNEVRLDERARASVLTSQAVAAETERCAVVCDKRTGTSEQARARV